MVGNCNSAEILIEILRFWRTCCQQTKEELLILRKQMVFLESVDPPEARADSRSFFKLSDPVFN